MHAPINRKARTVLSPIKSATIESEVTNSMVPPTPISIPAMYIKLIVMLSNMQDSESGQNLNHILKGRKGEGRREGEGGGERGERERERESEKRKERF